MNLTPLSWLLSFPSKFLQTYVIEVAFNVGQESWGIQRREDFLGIRLEKERSVRKKEKDFSRCINRYETDNGIYQKVTKESSIHQREITLYFEVDPVHVTEYVH